MTLSVRRRRLALYALFFFPGLGMASWVTRTPAIRDALGASTSEMGLILLGLSVGSFAGILASGPLAARYSTRPPIIVGAILVSLSMLVIAAGAHWAAPWLMVLGLLLFGLGMGGGEIAMNIEGADIEKLIARPLLQVLHGCFSLGTVIGSIIGFALTAADFSVAAHLLLVAAMIAPSILIASRNVPHGTGMVSAAADRGGSRRTSRAPFELLRDRPLMMIGLIVLAMAIAEGAANDWLPLIMVDGHGFSQVSGSALFVLFASAMTLGRFTGGTVLRRYGRAKVLRFSAAITTIGVGMVVLVDSQAIVVLAVVLWGLGASLGFPVAISAAGASGATGAESNRRVSLAATMGFLAFLVGPPILGVIGEQVGLRGAFVVVVALAALAIFLAPFAKPRAHEPSRSSST